LAIGSNAGVYDQNEDAIAIGPYSGVTQQGIESIAIGRLAGNTNQGANAIAIGKNSGKLLQGIDSIAIGHRSGYQYQGTNSIYIGSNAIMYDDEDETNTNIDIQYTTIEPRSIHLIAGKPIDYEINNGGLFVNSIRSREIIPIPDECTPIYFDTTSKELFTQYIPQLPPSINTFRPVVRHDSSFSLDMSLLSHCIVIYDNLLNTDQSSVNVTIGNDMNPSTGLQVGHEFQFINMGTRPVFFMPIEFIDNYTTTITIYSKQCGITNASPNNHRPPKLLNLFDNAMLKCLRIDEWVGSSDITYIFSVT
jgi:hypothetical protein